MAKKSGPGKTSDNNRHRVEADGDNRLINELMDRISVLEQSTDLIKHAPAGIYEIDFNGPCFRSVNDYMCQATGYTREELLAMNPYDLLDEESKILFLERLQKQMSGQKIDDMIGYTGRTKGGRRVCWNLNVAFTYVNDELGGAIVVAQDVTRHKRMEDARRESEARFQSVLKNSRDVIYRVDAQTGQYEYISPSAETVMGFSPEELISQDAETSLSMIHPDDRPAIREALACLEDTGKAEAIYRQQTKSGDYRWISNYMSLTRDSAGRPLYREGNIRDISERRLAEEALRESEENYRELVESSNSIILRSDRNGNITYLNEFAQRFFGYSEAEIIGRNSIGTIIPARDSSGRDLKAMLDDLFRRPEEYRTNTNENMRKNGEIVWVSWTNKAIYDNMGCLTGLLCIGNDITRFKQAEMALRESEERMRMAAAVARIYAWDVDLQTQKLRFSNGYEEISGYHVRPEISQGISSFHPEDMERIYDKFMRAIGRGGDFEIEYDRFNPGMQEKQRFMIMGTVVNDNRGRPVQVIGVTQDITDRKRAEEALRESEEKYRSVYQQSAIGIARVGIDYRFIDVNQKFCDITGYPVEELLDMNFVGITHPEDADSDVRYAEMLLSGRINTYSMEKRYVRKDGSLIWVNLTVSMVRNSDGTPHNFVSIVEDISERKQADEELIEAKAQAELYLDLMGHDINNLHQIALGYLELIQDMQLNIDQYESLDKPIEVLKRSAQLIQNVRKLQMLKEGRFQSLEVDVCRMLIDVQRELGAIPHKTITLELNGCDHCYVRANELTHDVIANLVSNAIKHTGNKADINMSLSIVNDNGVRYCRIVVEDNGPGIHDDFKGRIFNRTLKSTNKAKGMGLGLYLVKSLVDSYNGRVRVEDRVPGDHTQGARFVVLLPTTRFESN